MPNDPGDRPIRAGLALCLALVQATLPLAGAAPDATPIGWRSHDRQRRGSSCSSSIAFGCARVRVLVTTISACCTSRSIRIRALPAFYGSTAVWGAHEGSMLLWIMVLAIWTLAVAAVSRSQPRGFREPRARRARHRQRRLIAFALFTSNPFERLMPTPADGRD